MSVEGDGGGSSGGCGGGPSANDLRMVLKDAPTESRPRARVVGADLISLAVDVGAFKSKGEARRMIKSGGMYVNQQRVSESARVIEEADLVDGSLLVLRVGRKKFTVVEVVE